jgi:putative methionine-R-sulfoxide reductase with GAF domain
MTIDNIKNSRKLEQILLNFIDVLRINILAVDSKGSPVLVPKTDGYGFTGASQWGTLQYLGKPEFLPLFQIEGNYLKSIDAFGLQYFAIPIPLGNMDDIGYLIVGPVILNKQFEQSRYQTIAQELNLNLSDFQDSLNEVRVVTFNSLKSILDLLFELSRYALRMNYKEKRKPVAKIDQAESIQSIFTTFLDLSMAITQAECGSIMLLNNLTNELNILTYKGLDLRKVQNIPIKLGEGIAGLAAQKKESFVIGESRSNNRIRHLLKKPELKCAVVLPIMKNNKDVLGVMNISTHQGTSRLATHSQQMLKSLMEITSGTFKNFK